MSLTPEEQAAADDAVAQLRAERDAAAEGDWREWRDGFAIEHEHVPGPVDERVDGLLAEQTATEAEDFDAFWQAQARQGKALRNVRGVDLSLPASLPLAFEIESRRLMHDRSVAAVHRLFGLLFGEGALAELIAKGLDGEQLSVLLMWGSANGNGRDMTLGEAKVEFERTRARQAAGKALVPPTSGGTSSGTGRSSRPTSPASTRRKKKR